MTAADRGLAYANFGFDAHMMDIYPTLSCGGTVYIIPTAMRLDLQSIHDYIEKNRITIAFFTTQIGVQLSTSFPNSSLRLMSVGGEKLLPMCKPAYRFFNGYGPTECTIFSTVYEMKADYDTERIGRPLANYQAYVMVPAIYMKLAVLPLTPNGKVDRRALPLPQLDSLFAYVAPSNEIEKKICAVYSKILHREQVGVLDDFFALGGTSLSAMRAIIELSNAGCSISYGTMPFLYGI